MIPLYAQSSKECVLLEWFTVNVKLLNREIREKYDLYCYLFCTHWLQNQLPLWSSIDDRIKLNNFFVNYFWLQKSAKQIPSIVTLSWQMDPWIFCGFFSLSFFALFHYRNVLFPASGKISLFTQRFFLKGTCLFIVKIIVQVYVVELPWK